MQADFTKNNYRHFSDDGPYYMETTETYELDSGMVLVACVEFEYSREKGLAVSQVAWLNKDGVEGSFSALPWHEQVWLINDFDRLTKRHAAMYFEKAFAYFELNQTK